MPNWKQFLTEGALTNYRSEKEGMKLTINNFKNGFQKVLEVVIEERIPFWFDCQGNKVGDIPAFTKLGYLMNESINGQAFDGYILGGNEEKFDAGKLKRQLEKILLNVYVEKPGKLYIGRSNYADLTKSADIDTITVVVKAFKNFYKDKGLSSREISGNKYEAKVNIDFLCDTNNANNVIDFVF